MKVTHDYRPTYPYPRQRIHVPKGHVYSHSDRHIFRIALPEASSFLTPQSSSGGCRALCLEDGNITTCITSTIVMDHGPITHHP